MKTRSWAIAQKNINKNLRLTAMMLVGATFGAIAQISDLATAQPAPTIIPNTATATYREPISGNPLNITSNQILINQTPLIDPFGRITSCSDPDGGILPDYTGFSVGLYASNANGDIGLPVSLTATLPPNQAGTPKGLPPNYYNANPFFLTNSDQGGYNFLLDVGRGQLISGTVYVLVINPPANSTLGGRRIKLTIGNTVGNTVNYTATALDGQPIASDNNDATVNGSIEIGDAAAVGLSLTVINVNVAICDEQEIQILKTGDRAAAEPGDIVLYRLTVRNLASSAVTNPEIIDDLPLGFEYVDGSIRTELNGVAVPVTVTRNGRTLTFKFNNLSLPIATANQTLNIVYAAQITNDAVRGTGRNRATISAFSGNNIVKDGPVSHLLRIRRGILSDCGSLIGRVFIDKNFDGEQQPGEPGVPNAVIYMDDGNRIVTDPNGLYSLSNVISGSRSLAIDLTSIPGYTLAPNLYFIERNSQSRLLRLAPGALGRVNFAVTPAARGISGTKDGGKK